MREKEAGTEREKELRKQQKSVCAWYAHNIIQFFEPKDKTNQVVNPVGLSNYNILCNWHRHLYRPTFSKVIESCVKDISCSFYFIIIITNFIILATPYSIFLGFIDLNRQKVNLIRIVHKGGEFNVCIVIVIVILLYMFSYWFTLTDPIGVVAWRSLGLCRDTKRSLILI